MREELGFTIIEALVAMAILAVVLVAYYGVGADSLNASRHISGTDHAILLAQSKLEELSLEQTPLSAHESGQFPEGEFAWDVAASTIADDQSNRENSVLQNVVLKLTWHDGLTPHSISVETRHLGTRKL